MRQLPNILTLCNLFCGCCAIVSCFNNRFDEVFVFFCLGFLFDAIDGPVARKLGISSPLGKELDSLADMVSFGVLPGVILYQLIIVGMNYHPEDWMKYLLPKTLSLPALPAFLVTVFACYRLAKFNIDTTQTNVFKGLATPATTTFVIGLMMMYAKGNVDTYAFLLNPYVYYVIIAALCYLQISDLPLMKFRMENYAVKGNETRYLFLISTILAAVFLKEAVFAVAIILYIIFSMVHFYVLKNDKN